jgi:CheY-like chemotaxis protein
MKNLMEDDLEQASPKPLKLVLMDLNMPVMDGIEATKRIKSRWQGRAPPIIALTAYNTGETRDACEEVGMTGFLAKPLDFGQLDIIMNDLGIQVKNPAPNVAERVTHS